MTIDVHSHWTPPSFRRAIDGAAGRDAELARRLAVIVHGKARELADLDQRLDAMDAAGITVSILSLPPPGVTMPGVPTAELASRVNDELIAAAEAHPGRFVVLAALPLPDTVAAVAELERIGNHELVRGVALLTTTAGWTLDEPRLEDTYQRIAALGLPILLHPAFDESPCVFHDWALETSLAAPVSSSLGALRLMLSGMLDRVPGLTPIVPHLGGTLPFLAQRIVDQSATGSAEHDVAHYLRHRVYLDTCSYHPPALRCALDTVGAHRVLLGSDYPFRGGLDRCVDDVRSAGLPPEQQHAILAGNASAFFSPADRRTP